MRPICFFVAIVLFCGGLPVCAATKKSQKHHSNSKAVPATSHAKSSRSARKGSATTAARGKRRSRYTAKARPSGPPRQMTPSAERYSEIQQALASKGYFQGTVNGQWGPDSVAALKRFQEEQHLTADGKIGALSLIALGLGPRQDASAGDVAKPNEQLPQGQQ